MTYEEKKIERRHTYENSLARDGVMGCPNNDEHNRAVAEADQHMKDLDAQDRRDKIALLSDFKATL